MLGNVWEWIDFSKLKRRKQQHTSRAGAAASSSPPAAAAAAAAAARPAGSGGMRGGSFIDSADGLFNHAVATSTQQVTEKNNAANNIGQSVSLCISVTPVFMSRFLIFLSVTGFRCAKSDSGNGSASDRAKTTEGTPKKKSTAAAAAAAAAAHQDGHVSSVVEL